MQAQAQADTLPSFALGILTLLTALLGAVMRILR